MEMLAFLAKWWLILMALFGVVCLIDFVLRGVIQWGPLDVVGYIIVELESWNNASDRIQAALSVMVPSLQRSW